MLTGQGRGSLVGQEVDRLIKAADTLYHRTLLNDRLWDR